MLIYNFQKEFLGVDEKTLRAIGFKDLTELRAEVSDFADLFVKTPGYIHNFQHVHWIDFVACAESNEEPQVIIHVNNKNYKATLQITTLFLMDSPSSQAYSIHLGNLRELSAQESESIAADIKPRSAPKPLEVKPILNTSEHNETFVKSEKIESVTPDPYEVALETEMSQEEDFVAPPQVEEKPLVQEEAPLDIDLDLDDEIVPSPQQAEEKTLVQEEAPLDIDLDLDDDLLTPPQIQNEAPETTPETTPETKKRKTKKKIIKEQFDNGYIYNPQVACDELGLPLELVEEFVEDFIAQAKEFKDGLYKALDTSDLDTLKSLAHKLKGVAANLRIEDALEVLITLNTSTDSQILRENLEILYKIVAKLAHEEIITEIEVPDEDTQEESSTPISGEQSIAPLDLDDTTIAPLELDDDKVTPEPVAPLELDDEKVAPEPVAPLELDDDLGLTLQEDVQKDDAEANFVAPVVNYSKEKIAHAIGLDVESFHELFEDYINDAKSLILAMQDAIQNQDFNACNRSALQLKGMSENMQVDDLAQELKIATTSQDKDELIEAINTLDAYITQLAKEGDD